QPKCRKQPHAKEPAVAAKVASRDIDMSGKSEARFYDLHQKRLPCCKSLCRTSSLAANYCLHSIRLRIFFRWSIRRDYRKKRRNTVGIHTNVRGSSIRASSQRTRSSI